jgi:hypothetical protein
LGLTEAKLQALADFEHSADLNDLEKLCLRYAVGMTTTPVEVADDLFDELRRHFNNQQLVELTSAIAWENYRARFDHALGIEAEGFSKGSFCPMPTAGSAKEVGMGDKEWGVAERAFGHGVGKGGSAVP